VAAPRRRLSLLRLAALPEGRAERRAGGGVENGFYVLGLRAQACRLKKTVLGQRRRAGVSGVRRPPTGRKRGSSATPSGSGVHSGLVCGSPYDAGIPAAGQPSEPNREGRRRRSSPRTSSSGSRWRGVACGKKKTRKAGEGSLRLPTFDVPLPRGPPVQGVVPRVGHRERPGYREPTFIAASKELDDPRVGERGPHPGQQGRTPASCWVR
jgi:hypothetical protein